MHGMHGHDLLAERGAHHCDGHLASNCRCTPRVQVQHAMGAVSAIVDALPPSSTKPPRRSRQQLDAATSNSPLAAIAEDEQAPVATAAPLQQQGKRQRDSAAAAAAAEIADDQAAPAGLATGSDAADAVPRTAKGRKANAGKAKDRQPARKRPAEAASADEQTAADEAGSPGAPPAAKPAKRRRKAAADVSEVQGGIRVTTDDQDAASQRAEEASAVPAAELENTPPAEGSLPAYEAAVGSTTRDHLPRQRQP